MTEIVIAVMWAVTLAGAGGALTTIGPWYRGLRKPTWQPPDWAFGPAWTIILGLAAGAAVLSWRGAETDGERALVPVLFGVNGVLHVGWSLLFFRLRRPDWAGVEVVGLWLSILAMVVLLAPLSAVASWMVLPYLAWVSFASVLNWAIVRRNAPFLTAGAV